MIDANLGVMLGFRHKFTITRSIQNWLLLLYEAYENLNKPMYIILRFPGKNFPSFDKVCCLLSYYQVRGNSM